MKLAAADIKRLRWPLLLLALAGAAGGGGIYASQQFALSQRAATGTRPAQGLGRHPLGLVAPHPDSLLAGAQL